MSDFTQAKFPRDRQEIPTEQQGSPDLASTSSERKYRTLRLHQPGKSLTIPAWAINPKAQVIPGKRRKAKKAHESKQQLGRGSEKPTGHIQGDLASKW